MAGRRMIKVGLWKSDKLLDCSSDTVRLLYVWLCLTVDDDAKMACNPRALKMTYYGAFDKITQNVCEKMLKELCGVGLIYYYKNEATGKSYVEIPGWKKYNTLDKAHYKKSELPTYSKDLHIMLTDREHNGHIMRPECDCNPIQSNPIQSNKEELLSALAGRVICDLNKRAGTRFRVTPKVINLIKTRVKEKVTEQEFFKVNEKMIKAWADTDMAKYIRPETLYSNKFDGYLNQLQGKKKRSDYIGA